MVGWYEIVGERNDPKEMGGVQLNTFYETRKKPVWLVGVKLLGLLAMLAAGYAMFVPFLPLPLWQSIMAVSGAILIYVGIAFFFRPQPNADNMGFLGGMFNDPTHYSDNVNRTLWKAHCLLGPGRFAAETLLDCCTLFGMTAEVSAEQHQEEVMEKEQSARAREKQRWRDEAMRQVSERQNERPGGEMELSSARYLDPDRFGD
jgi:hypothetical protein